MPQQALAGFKVVDLGHHIAGPYCTKLLAELGAEVVKIERPDGDPVRKMGPFFQDDPHPEKSLLYLYLNTGKKSITLNLKTELGKKVFKDLVKDADILMENFSPRVMPGLGLDYPILEKLNPGLVMTSISNFGQTGPYRDYKATDLNIMAIGGLMYMNGEPEREPLTFGGGLQAQYQGGAQGFAATMIALWYKEWSGEGQHVDVSLMECITQVLEYPDLVYQITGEIYQRTGTAWVNLPAWGVYPCKDGYVGLVHGAPRRWRQIGKLMGIREFEDLSIYARRRELRDQIDALMLPWLLEHTKDEVYKMAQAQKPEIPASPVRTPADLVNSEHFKERGYFVEVDHPITGPKLYPGAPVKLSETPYQISRAPVLGEHNEEIYCQRLGYTKDDLVRMKGEGVV